MEPKRGRPMLPGVRVRGPYQRRDGRWQVETREGDGSRRCRTFPSADEAREYADGLIAAVRTTVPITLEEALGDYERGMKARGLKPGSIKSAMLHLRRFFPDTALRLRLLTFARVQGLYKQLVDEGLAQGTHRTYLLSARTLFAWCVDEGLMASNPATGVKVLGRRRYGKPQHRVDELRLWEAEAFRRATVGDQQALAALMALYLGMRATEITHRVVRDLDDGGRILWIPDAKTETGRRALDVPDVLIPMLVALVEGRDRGAPLFVGERKPRRHRDWIREGVQRICWAAKVPMVSAHAMRGALATIAAERGQLGHMAAAHFGHTTPVMTEQAYAKQGAKESGARAKGLAVLQGGRR